MDEDPFLRDLADPLESTDWSALTAGDVEHLVRAYWKPVLRHLRSQRLDEATAEDVTQDFFLRMLETRGILRARPERGLFRTFLFHAARQFLVDYRRRESTIRRGGGVMKLSLEEIPEPASTGDDPQEVFDRHWFSSLLNAARRSLRRHYTERGTPRIYEAFHLYYYGSDEPGRWTQPRIAEA